MIDSLEICSGNVSVELISVVVDSSGSVVSIADTDVVSTVVKTAVVLGQTSRTVQEVFLNTKIHNLVTLEVVQEVENEQVGVILGIILVVLVHFLDVVDLVVEDFVVLVHFLDVDFLVVVL